MAHLLCVLYELVSCKSDRSLYRIRITSQDPLHLKIAAADVSRCRLPDLSMVIIRLCLNGVAVALLVLGAGALGGCRPDIRTSTGRPDGAKLYGLYCEGCHGPDGKKKVDGSRDLSALKEMSDSDVRSLIRDGRGKMPPLGPYLKDAQISAILRHLRSLGTAPSLTRPATVPLPP